MQELGWGEFPDNSLSEGKGPGAGMVWKAPGTESKPHSGSAVRESDSGIGARAALLCGVPPQIQEWLLSSEFSCIRVVLFYEHHILSA